MRSNHPSRRSSARHAAAGALLASLALCSGSSAEDAPGKETDLLRFLNGDSLHGTFDGIEEGATVRWIHPHAREAILLENGKLRRIAFNGGRSTKALQSSSYIRLDGGDRIPGKIVALDEESATLETEMAGTLTIPRKHISSLAPSPHGGTVHYIGPFSATEWTVLEPEEEEADPDAEKETEEKLKKPADEPPAKEEEPKEEESEEGPWVFSGGAYYSNSQLPITVDAKAPSKTRIRFNLAWRNRLNAAIAFHATLSPPEEVEPEEDGEKPGKVARARVLLRDSTNSSGFALLYGHSYVLTIYSNYAQLYRCDFDEDGKPAMDRLSNSSANLRLDESGAADFELRCDRDAGIITLFADGRYISQWEDPRGYVGTGTHLGFACQSSSSRLRVSDVVVTAWNGMIDSARSMEVDDRDIVLMTNGTDRFSGEVLALADDKLTVKGTYAELHVPLDQIQEIRFARKEVVKLPDTSREAVRLLLHPTGRLTLTPMESTRTSLKARHSALGDINLDLRYVGLLEFSFGDSVLDSWDDDF